MNRAKTVERREKAKPREAKQSALTDREREYYRNLHEIAAAVSSVLDQGRVLQIILETLARAMNARGTALMLLTPDRKVLVHTADCGLSDLYIQKGPVAVDRSLSDALKGLPVAVLDATADERVQYRRQNEEEGIASILSAPVRLEGDVVGVVRVYTSDRRRFTDADIYFVEAVANLGAIALQNADIYEKKYYRHLHEIAAAVSSVLHPDRVLKSIVEGVARAMNAKGAALMLLTPDRRTLLYTADYGLSEWYTRKGPVTVDKSIAQTLDGSPVAVFDATADERVQYRRQNKEEGIASILCAPVKLGGNVVGVLRVYTSDHRRFTDADTYFVQAVANLGAISLENANIHSFLRKDYQELRDFGAVH